MKKLLSLFIILLFISSPLFAQDWVSMMKDQNANVHDVQKVFYAWYANQPKNDAKVVKGETEDEKDGAYMQFKRWEWMMEARTFPSGNRPDLNKVANDYKNFTDTHNKAVDREQNTLAVSNWSYTGNTSVPMYGGAGRVNYFRFMPGNSNVIFACCPTGGLWESTNGGATWATKTDQQLVDLAISDIAINPLNTNVMYISTGDGDGIGGGYTTLSTIGVMKSTDGGNTWNPTGLTYTQPVSGPAFNTVNQLLIHPTDTNLLLAGTSFGLYRTINGGTNWTQVNTDDFRSLECEPFHPSTMYAATNNGKFYRSVDSGATWNVIVSGLPAAANGQRVKIAVSPADSNYVYVLEWQKGIYRSTDRGQTFTQQSTFDPIGGQGWYDLGFNVSPTNKDSLLGGGLDNYCSPNGGVTWNQVSSWTGSGYPYVHADVHGISWLPGSGASYFVCCDGGIFRYDLSSPGVWTDISSNLEIAEIYSVGPSATTPGLWFTGWQDNGSSLSQPWTEVLGGDGMVAFIDESNDNTLFGEQFEGQQNISTDGGATWASIPAPLLSAWVTPWMQDPMNPNVLYSVTSQVEESSNKGASWTQKSTWSPGVMSAEAVDANNDQILAAAAPNQIEYTTNNGASWTNITSGLPVASAGITGIAIDPYKPSHIYVTFSGYVSTAKVYMSSNSGATWTNISAGLPNLPVNCILLPNNVPLGHEGIYVGTDKGVYYHDTISGWMNYSTNLPNVIVNDLKYFNPTGTLIAATYGRGIWTSAAAVNGINTIADNNGSVKVYPNPTNGALNVTLNLPKNGSYTMTVANMLGQTVYSRNITVSGVYFGSIDMSNFAKGSYILSIKGQGIPIIKRVVLQ